MEELQVTEQALDMEIDAEWGGLEEPTMDPVEEEAAEPEQETVTEQNVETPVESEKADQPEMFPISAKFKGEEKWVTKEEAKPLLQKGMHYDEVRSERDELRAYKQANDAAVNLVKRYAESMGKTIPEYLDYVREQELMAGGMTQEAATRQLNVEKREAAVSDREAKIAQAEEKQNGEQAKEQERQERLNQQFSQFQKAYPKVDPNTIPKEVWDMFTNDDVPLTTAYTIHENKRLMAEIEAEKKNKENKALTTGSLSGNAMTDADEIDRIWAECD